MTPLSLSPLVLALLSSTPSPPSLLLCCSNSPLCISATNSAPSTTRDLPALCFLLKDEDALGSRFSLPPSAFRLGSEEEDELGAGSEDGEDDVAEGGGEADAPSKTQCEMRGVGM